MHRILLEIPLPGGGAVPIYSYGFMLMLAFLAGTALAWRRGLRVGIPGQVVLDIALYAVIAGIIGARLAYILFEHVPDPTAHPLFDLVAIWKGGLVFQGGLVMALGVCLWYLAAHRLSPGQVADLFAPGIALGIALGRVGCFLNGCCWGKLAPPDFPLAVRFPPESMVYHHHAWLRASGELFHRMQDAGYETVYGNVPLPLPVHPAQLYTSVAMLGVFLLILLVERLPRIFDGMVMLVFLMAYSVVRFHVEFVRDDTPAYWAYGDFPGLRMGQILGVPTLLASVAAFCYLWARAARRRREAIGDTEGD